MYFDINIFRNLCAWMHVVHVRVKPSIVLTEKRRRSYGLKQSIKYCILHKILGVLGKKMLSVHLLSRMKFYFITSL